MNPSCSKSNCLNTLLQNMCEFCESENKLITRLNKVLTLYANNHCFLTTVAVANDHQLDEIEQKQENMIEALLFLQHEKHNKACIYLRNIHFAFDEFLCIFLSTCTEASANTIVCPIKYALLLRCILLLSDDYRFLCICVMYIFLFIRITSRTIMC